MAIVLIADDDPIVRLTVGEFLGAVGHSVLEAADGQEALDTIATVQIDLLVVDMLMPNMDGLETILAVRRSGSTLPIIAISSGGRMDRSTLLRPAAVFGANATLSKPLLRDLLVSTVEAILAENVVVQSH
jgi:CheY-like chemotaxis protein